MSLKDVSTDRIKNVDHVLQEILKKPGGDFSEDHIHDVRTSIRRLQSTYKMLPRRAREQKNLYKYMDACNGLFRVLNDIRDYDVMLSRLSEYPESDATKKVKSFVTKKRTNLLGRASKRVLAIEDAKSKKLRVVGVSETQLDKRFKIRLEKQAKKVRDDLLVVWTGKAKKSQVHKLRKDCKKLRYTLELEEKKYEKQMQILKEWQGYLGTIHDVEMFQGVLRRKNNDRGALDHVIKAEESKGTESYATFMNKSRNEETRAVIDTLFVGTPKPEVSPRRAMKVPSKTGEGRPS